MTLPKILVTRQIIGLDRYQSEFDFELWTEDRPMPRDLILERAAHCEAIVSMLTDRLDAVFFDAHPHLKVVSQCAVGVNNIDLVYAKQKGIPIGHTPGVLTDATADLTWALLLSSARNILPGADYVQQGKWVAWGPSLLLGREVTGSTLGVIGYGRIGQAVVERARGFRMTVLAHHKHPITDSGVRQTSLDELLTESDFISINVPLNAETYHLIGARELALMKPTATLINTARGEIVDAKALTAALQAGRPGFAALDVTEPEPIPVDHPLLKLPNCLIIPHLGTSTVETRLAMTARTIENLRAGVRGERLPFLANP